MEYHYEYYYFNRSEYKGIERIYKRLYPEYYEDEQSEPMTEGEKREVVEWLELRNWII